MTIRHAVVAMPLRRHFPRLLAVLLLAAMPAWALINVRFTPKLLDPMIAMSGG